MDRIKLINMIPSMTVKSYFIENDIKLTPLEELTIVRHCFKDIKIKEEAYNRYSFHKDEKVKGKALELICELNIFKSYIRNEDGKFWLQMDGSNIAFRDFQTLLKSFKTYGETDYTKVHIEDDSKNLLSTFWMNKSGKIIFYKLWDEEEVLSIFNIEFNSLPFTYKQLLKPVEQLFENQKDLFVNLSDMNDTIPGVIAVVKMNDYIRDIDHAEEDEVLHYISPLYFEDYELEDFHNPPKLIPRK